MLAEYILQRLAGVNVPVFSEKKCLNQRGRKKPCSLCRDHCPAGAIQAEKKKVFLDESLCDGCSVCTTVCPSTAFSREKGYFIEALQKMHNKSPVFITCRDSAIAAPDLVVPCLGGVPWEFFAALAVQVENRAVVINISNCWRCYRQKSFWLLYRNVQKARLFLEGCGRTLSLQARVTEPIPQQRTAAVSRRDAFSLLAGKIKKETITAFLPASRDQGEEEKLRYWLQGNQAVLQISAAPGELPFKNWQVGESCQACGFCQGVCPQQAWQLLKEGDSLKLIHDAWKCTSCGLCQSLCPYQALADAPWDALPLTGGKEKKNLSLKPCKSCKALTVLQKDFFCLSCSRKEKIKSHLISASYLQGKSKGEAR